ncbi:MAG: LON peptidase substrate-binding domain-containing protein [Candidatus Binatia bacterium]
MSALTYNTANRYMVNVSNPPKSLPEILPVFPLTGVLLLPEMILPLHIFEPRYRNMVDDALNGDGVFGMIQPFVPRHDNRPLPGSEKETPELYKIGCAGYIERWEKLPDGRYVIQLRGLNRFRSENELPLHRGYRRVKANYNFFPDSSLDKGWQCERDALTRALEGYAKAQGLNVQLDQVERVTDNELVDILAMSLPLHPAEKQALLEAPSIRDRETVLLDLLNLGAGPSEPNSGPPPRTVH